MTVDLDFCWLWSITTIYYDACQLFSEPSSSDRVLARTTWYGLSTQRVRRSCLLSFRHMLKAVPSGQFWRNWVLAGGSATTHCSKYA